MPRQKTQSKLITYDLPNALIRPLVSSHESHYSQLTKGHWTRIRGQKAKVKISSKTKTVDIFRFEELDVKHYEKFEFLHNYLVRNSDRNFSYLVLL